MSSFKNEIRRLAAPHISFDILRTGIGDASRDALTAIKSFIDQAGFEVDVDIADPGRFFGSFWGKGFEDMALFFTGLDPTYLVTFQRGSAMILRQTW